jgi:putative acetyltransferase
MNSAPQVAIRSATRQDAALVASLLRQAFAEFEPLYTKKGYASTTPGADAILLRLDEGPLWLALHEHQTVGTASVVPKETGLYVRGMAVLPEARGLGVGRRLLEQVELYAVEKCCERLFLSTTPFLSRAIRLYEGFGFRASDRPPHDLFGTPLFTMEKVLSRNPLAI